MRIFVYAIIFVLTGAAAFFLPVSYRYDDFKDYSGLLSGISGMVFTIMGIWIAFIYPNALSRLVNQEKIATADFSETLSDTKRLEAIVAAVLKSAIVAVGLLFMLLAKIFLWRTDFYSNNILVVKSCALAFLMLGTVIQIEAIASVIVANVMFINDLHRKRQDRKVEADM